MHNFRLNTILALALAAAIAAPLAQAATHSKTSKSTSSAIEQSYQREVARCKSGQSQQDRATCMREAGAARAEARKGNLTDPGTADLARNATARCNAQPAPDQDDCMKRVTGAGDTRTQGSVMGGGLIRETVTPVKP
ncbi:MAG: hypothetical protein H7346_03920 [Burkholderiaceae bacterium]|nr:hypothetical protein [Burkholderiaceae bacterium]